MSVKTAPITWILVADRCRALFFRSSESDLSDIKLLKTIEHPEGHLKPQEINTDKPGRFPSEDGSHPSGDPTTDIRHHSAEEFAKTIIEALDHARNHDEFDHVVLVAPPLMLGELRKKCDSPLAKCITVELDLELANLPDRDIQARLQEELCEK